MLRENFEGLANNLPEQKLKRSRVPDPDPTAVESGSTFRICIHFLIQTQMLITVHLGHVGILIRILGKG
jgi:hypothetical protein